MFKKLAIASLLILLLGPSLGLISLALVMNPAAVAACTIGSGPLTVGDIPDELAVESADGHRFTLNHTQLTHAATIIEVGSRIDDVTRDGIQIALMAALTESTLRQLSNTAVYPDSGDYPNDGNGSDNDSLGLFQMRPASGWGTVAELMDTTYQAEAFYGGPTGPNAGSPRGLLDIPGWQDMGKGEAAQSVEVSAYPDRYDNYAPVAATILDTLVSSSTTGPVLGGSSRVVFPLPEGTWSQASSFGPRIHPITHEPSFHTGADFGAAEGTPILAAADGTVTIAEMTSGYGGLIVIEHTIDGETIATAYAHMWQEGILVTAGDTVTSGQHIGDVGTSGRSNGPHLHFEVRPGGTNAQAIDPAGWLNDHDAADLPEADDSASPCGKSDASTNIGGRS